MLKFNYHSDDALWKSEETVRLLGSDLEVWLDDETGDAYEGQQRILTFALERIPSLEADCRRELFAYYQDACEDFPDLVGTPSLPVIADEDGLSEIFGFTVLEIPQQIEGRGINFKVLGGCTWNEEDGVQMFFRDGALEQVDSDAALWF